MKCPFELPIEKKTRKYEEEPNGLILVQANGKLIHTAGRDKYNLSNKLDYILQAINSHEKYKALIESELKGMRKMIADNENDPQMRPFAQVLKGRVALYRETLKEEKE